MLLLRVVDLQFLLLFVLSNDIWSETILLDPMKATKIADLVRPIRLSAESSPPEHLISLTFFLFLDRLDEGEHRVLPSGKFIGAGRYRSLELLG